MLLSTYVFLMCWSTAFASSRNLDIHDRETHENRSPAEKMRDRMAKYDRLVETVRQNKASVPGLEEEIALLKAREEAIYDAESVLPPQPPRLAFSSEDEEDEEDEPMSAFGHGSEEFHQPKFEHHRDNPQAREDMMRKSRERLDRLKDLDPEERMAEMRREREERIGTSSSSSEEGRREFARVFRTRSPDKKRKNLLEHLTPAERHAKLLDHQRLMEEHRSEMDEWRKQHHAHKEERRAIMNAYRDLLHQTREAILDSRPL